MRRRYWVHWEKNAKDGAARQREKRRLIDVLREDIQVVGVTEEDAEEHQNTSKIHTFHDPVIQNNPKTLLRDI